MSSLALNIQAGLIAFAGVGMLGVIAASIWEQIACAIEARNARREALENPPLRVRLINISASDLHKGVR
jgi:hypothetical protein